MRRRTVMVVGLLGVAVAALAFSPRFSVHWVSHKRNDAQLLWNDHEAYLFIGSSRLGWRGNYLAYLGSLAGAYLGVSPRPTQALPEVFVARITPAGVARQRTKHVTVGLYSVVEGRIYTHSDRTLFRVAGTGFERVAADDQRRIEASAEMFKKSGWLWEPTILSRGRGRTTFRVRLDGQNWTVTVDTKWHPEELGSIEVHKGDGPPMQVWSLNTRSRYVSAEEYERFLAE